MQVAVIYRLGKGMTPPIPETLSPVGKEFLSLCLKINPADRPSAASLLEHPFVKNSEQLDGNWAFNGKNLTINIIVMPFIVAKLLFLW